MDPLMPAAVLEFDQVHYAYPAMDRAAVNGVSFAVRRGEGVALLGPNGAGKTTVLRLAMALLRPGGGRVRVGGRDTSRLVPEDIAPVAGYLFQQPESQLFERTVSAEIAFGPRQLGWEEPRVAARVAVLLERLGLAHAAAEHPYDLPLPRRRLVALGAALAAEPALLLLDEPTAALDRAGRELVTAVVAEHLAAGGAAVAVTHDTGFALEALPRAVVLERGAVVADAATGAVLVGSGEALPLPAHAAVARRLGLAPASFGLADVAAALALHCRSRS